MGMLLRRRQTPFTAVSARAPRRSCSKPSLACRQHCQQVATRQPAYACRCRQSSKATWLVLLSGRRLDEERAGPAEHEAGAAEAKAEGEDVLRAARRPRSR